MTQYVIIDEVTRCVLGGRGRRDPVDMTGPPDQIPDAESGTLLVAWQGTINFSGGIGVMEWLDGATEPSWRDNRAIEEVRAFSIDAIDTAADEARAKVLVKSTNTIEYQAALADAVKYRDAGFTGAAGRGVTSWSYAKRRQGWTDQQAAENILATADAWENALYFIREQRLDAKELVRDATTNSEVDTLLATFIATLTAAMQGVQ